MRKIIKMFKNGNVAVVGLRGTGKDMLFSNVVTRRKIPYISNIDYGGEYNPFSYIKINCGENTYRNFISGNINPYEYPYIDGTDLYISDCGIYFPSQYCSELNRLFPYLPVYMALSRHLGNSNVHYNTQNLNRVWDKIREQCDQYILCKWCIYIPIFKLVLQKVYIYEKAESCANRVPLFSVHCPLFAKSDVRAYIKLQSESYYCTHGQIKSRFLIYRNKSNYDTRAFKTILKGDDAKNENKAYS